VIVQVIGIYRKPDRSMDESDFHFPIPSFSAERLRIESSESQIFSPSIDDAPADLIARLNAFFSGNDPVVAAQDSLKIIICHSIWSSPTTVIDWFKSLKKDRDQKSIELHLSFLTLAFAHIPHDSDPALFSPDCFSILLRFFPDPRAVRVCSKIVDLDSSCLSKFLSKVGASDRNWTPVVSFFHNLFTASSLHPESFELLSTILSYRFTAIYLLPLMYDLMDTYRNVNSLTQTLILKTLTKFCERESTVSDLFIDRNSVVAVFEFIGEDSESIQSALQLARAVTAASSQNLAFMKKTRLSFTIRESVSRIDLPAIVCLCQILSKVMQVGHGQAVSYLMDTGVIHELNQHKNRFAFIAREEFAVVLCAVCHFGSAGDIENVLRMDALELFIEIVESCDSRKKGKWLRKGLGAITDLFVVQKGKMSDGGLMVSNEIFLMLQERDDSLHFLNDFFEKVRSTLDKLSL
jgi:hypothetical protein